MAVENDGRELVIRKIEVADARAAAQLSAELGYPVESGEMAQRIEKLEQLNGHAVLVACAADAVVGWIDIAIVHHLATGAHGEIGGLVVSAEYRSRGAGRALLARAEKWVAERRVGMIIVRSRTTRERAHRFYLREGYTLTKTSAVFCKGLEL
jgi:GNAT superfamily N-acetyltransferase